MGRKTHNKLRLDGNSLSCQLQKMDHIEFLRRQGKKGGKARAKKLSKKRRSEIGRMGAAVTNKQKHAVSA